MHFLFRCSPNGRFRAYVGFWFHCSPNPYLKAYSNVLDAKKQLNAYFEFYNLKRPHSSLDKMTPDEFYYDQLPQQNKVA